MTVIRQAAPDDVARIAEIHIASWRAAYRGILDDKALAKLDIASHAIQWQRALDGKVPVLVAEVEGGAVAGFASLRRDEITVLYLDPPHQRQGIGRMLLRRCLAELEARGHHRGWLWVLRDNLAARAFYEACGGRPQDEAAVTVGSQELRQVRYVWPLPAVSSEA